MKNRMQTIAMIMGGLLALLFGGAVLLHYLRGVHQLTLRNDQPTSIEGLVIIWPERKAELIGSLQAGQEIVVRHPVLSEGGTQLYYTRLLAGKRQAGFSAINDSMTPGKGTQGIYVFK